MGGKSKGHLTVWGLELLRLELKKGEIGTGGKYKEKGITGRRPTRSKKYVDPYVLREGKGRG